MNGRVDLTGRVASEVAALEGLNIEALREVWRGRFGKPPPLRSGDLLRRCLAERIQLEAFGSDPDLDRELDRLARAYRPGRPPALPRRGPRPGTRLIRHHDGIAHRVEVTEAGFEWQGRTYKSLSVIARQITGVRWNGPKFFGLRAEQAR